MAKSKTLCAHCDAKISSRHAFCPSCSQPTVFATVEQRTEWELAQWSQKRSEAAKKVAVHSGARKHAPVDEAPMREVTSITAPRMRTPVNRVQTPRTIHPAVAARRARQAAANATATEPVQLKAVTSTPEKRVIVLPEAVGGSAPVVKRPARPKMDAPVTPAPKAKPTTKAKPAPKAKAAAPKKEAAPEKPAAAATKPATKAAPKKAPKMEPMPAPAPAEKSNGHETNGHAAHDATAEQTEILRELLRRVAAIEEKMPAVAAPPARRFRLRKR